MHEMEVKLLAKMLTSDRTFDYLADVWWDKGVNIHLKSECEGTFVNYNLITSPEEDVCILEVKTGSCEISVSFEPQPSGSPTVGRTQRFWEKLWFVYQSRRVTERQYTFGDKILEN